MTKAILAVVFLLALGMITTVHADTANIFPLQDTFINWNGSIGSNYALGTNCGTTNVNIGGNYGNCGIMLTKEDSQNNRLATYFLFNISSVLNRIISSGNLSVQINTAPVGTCNYTLYTNSNTTWNETNLSGTYPTNNSIFESSTGLTIPLKNSISISQNFVGNPVAQNLIKNIYFNSNGLLTLVMDDVPTASCTSGDTLIYSKEQGLGTQAPLLNLSVSDFNTYLIQGTDISTIYFDFDTMTASTTPLPYYSWSYDSSTGVLTPYGANQYFYNSVNNPTNDLAGINCALGLGFYSSSAVSQLNNPVGTYDEYCFDLSASHAGRQFFGAIKIINNTNVRGGGTPEFDFYVAMYSPLYTQFTNFVTSPSPASAGRNLTIAWSTTTPLSTILRYQIYDPVQNTTSAVSTIFGNTNLTLQHQVTIDQSQLYAGGLTLTYFVVGQNSQNLSYTSATQSLLLSDFQEQLPEVTSGINIITRDEFNNPLRTFVSIDGITPFQTEYVVTNDSYGYAYLASFFGFGLGQHNITITANGYTTKNFTINDTAEPFFLTVKMSPFQACKLVAEVTSTDGSAGCESSTKSALPLYSSLNITSWYCIFNQAGCLTFDVNGTALCGSTQNGALVASGTWQGFACLDGYVPAGAPINGSIPIGSGLNGTGGANTGASGYGTSLGLTTEQSLNLLAMIVTLIATMIIGYYSKNGVVTGITFIGFLLLFTLINWFPWWALVIMAVITSFLIARFFRETMTPS